MNGYKIFWYTMIVLAAIGVAYFLVVLHNVWIVLIIAVLLASALRPAIMTLVNKGIPQSASILIVYGAVTAMSTTILLALLPPVINQFVGYIQDEDRLANRIIFAQFWVERTISNNTGEEVELGFDPDEIRRGVRDFAETVRVTAPDYVQDIASFMGDFVLIIVMGIYWITSREKAEQFLVSLVPMSRQSQVRAILHDIEAVLGAYVRGIALISIFVGLICFAALSLLNISQAATLSLIYALATVIPIVGGAVGVVMATILALLTSPASALVVLVVTMIIQQVENFYLSPRILSKRVEFDEILVIIFIAAGFTLDGITGGLIAIPIAGAVSILLKHLVLVPRKARIEPTRVSGGVVLDVEDHKRSSST